MNKIIIMLIMSFAVFSNGFEKINTFGSRVEEETLVNGQWRRKVYNLKITYPDKVIKEILEPELNKGEKILYLNEKKSIYYPIFDEVFEEELDGEENYILSALKSIKNNEGKTVEKEGQITELLLTEDNLLKFYDYVSIDGVEFPEYIEVYDKDTLFSKIKFVDIEINKEYSMEDYKIGI